MNSLHETLSHLKRYLGYDILSRHELFWNSCHKKFRMNVFSRMTTTQGLARNINQVKLLHIHIHVQFYVIAGRPKLFSIEVYAITNYCKGNT